MAFSGNPLTVEPPESIAALSPELYAYLRELNKTLHENYEKQESGAATFPADRFFSRYAKQEYPLGSEGRFVHADYGVLRGIFVRFAEMALESPVPLGWELQRFGQGFATSDFNKSETVLFLGFDLTQGPGEYGWVLSQGILPAAVNVAGGTGAFLEWGDAGMTATGISTGVSLVEAPEDGVAAIGSVLLKLSNAGDGLTGLENELANLADQLTGLEDRIIELDSDFEGVITLQNDVVTINQKLDRVSQSVTIANRAIAEFNADGVTAAMEQMLSVSRQYYDLTRGISENVDGMYQQVVISTNASFDAKQQAKSWSDQSGIYSQVSAERAGYAAIQAGASGESATAAFNYKEEALVYRDAAGNFAAEASSYASISASYANGLGQIALNPVFAIWSNPAIPPENWVNGFTLIGSFWIKETYATNQNRIKFDLTVPQNNIGFYQQIISQAPGEYVMEAEVELISGVWTGAGLSIDGLINMGFATEADINGVISSTQIGKRRFSKRFIWSGGTFTFYLMANWDGFAAGTAKVLKWYGATIRAVDGAYLSNKAAITTESAVRASADSAMASQITTLNAYFSGFTGGTVQAAITTEASTRASADTALTTSITTLRASVRGSKALTPNATFAAGSADWTLNSNVIVTVVSPTFTVLETVPGTAGVVESAATIKIDPTRKYKIHAKFAIGASLSQVTYVGIGCYDNTGAYLGNVYIINSGSSVAPGSYVWEAAYTGTGAVSGATVNQFKPGTTAITILILLNWTSVATAWSYVDELWFEDVSDSYDNAASITSEAVTRANADSALASSISTLSTTVGGHTATLTTYGTSISGLQAKYGVTIDVNGYVSGFQLNNGGGTSDFIVNVANFEIRNPSGGGGLTFDGQTLTIKDAGGVAVTEMGWLV